MTTGLCDSHISRVDSTQLPSLEITIEVAKRTVPKTSNSNAKLLRMLKTQARQNLVSSRLSCGDVANAATAAAVAMAVALVVGFVACS